MGLVCAARYGVTWPDGDVGYWKAARRRGASYLSGL